MRPWRGVISRMERIRSGNGCGSGPRYIPEIIGIVGDVKTSALNRDTTPAIYMSYLQSPENEDEPGSAGGRRSG